MSEFAVGVVGLAGRMGQTLASYVAGSAGCRLAGATERPGHAIIGKDVGEVAGLGRLGIAVTDDPAKLFGAADAVLDFTTPKATLAHAALAAKTGKILIVGTTGFETEDEAKLAEAAKSARIVKAPNMSLAVNLLMSLTRDTAKRLNEDFDIEIVEIHHRHKVDAPSGTALGLGRAAAQGRGVSLESHGVRGRDGITGARKRGTIGFAALRGGDAVGDHTVIFAAEGERLELTHKASSRVIYSRGALQAALWARDKKPGLYAMSDVLGLG